ncbi:MAG: methyltransferase domain-containing protein, partial [Deltaproteobacteria bacterium]
IRGGVEGRERLRMLARIMQPATRALFERIGISEGMSCLDAGCGGGDVTFELARRVGPSGRAVGIDLDEIKLGLARGEAATLGLENVAFRQAEIGACEFEPEFDVVYARFLLSHLPDPIAAIARMQRWLKPGGVLAVEDIDFTGHFCHPESAALRRYVDLYRQAVQRRGGDPQIGPRVPGLLVGAGFAGVEMNVVQPAGISGEVKLLNPVTMENIADAVVADGLASQAEVEKIIAELYEFARSPRTVVSISRIVQTWGRKP